MYRKGRAAIRCTLELKREGKGVKDGNLVPAKVTYNKEELTFLKGLLNFCG